MIYLPLQHHKFIKEEIKDLLEARHTERSLSLYAASIIIVPRKSKPEIPLGETKMLEKITKN